MLSVTVRMEVEVIMGISFLNIHVTALLFTSNCIHFRDGELPKLKMIDGSFDGLLTRLQWNSGHRV